MISEALLSVSWFSAAIILIFRAVNLVQRSSVGLFEILGAVHTVFWFFVCTLCFMKAVHPEFRSFIGVSVIPVAFCAVF